MDPTTRELPIPQLALTPESAYHDNLPRQPCTSFHSRIDNHATLNQLPEPSNQPSALPMSPAQSPDKSTGTAQDDVSQFQAELLAKIHKLRGDNAQLRVVADNQAVAVDRLEKLSNHKQKVYKRQFSRNVSKPTAAILMQKDVMAKAHAEWKLGMKSLQGEVEGLKVMRMEMMDVLESRGISTDETVLGWMAADVKRAKEEEVGRQAAKMLADMRREKEMLQMELGDLEMDNRLKREQIGDRERCTRREE